MAGSISKTAAIFSANNTQMDAAMDKSKGGVDKLKASMDKAAKESSAKWKSLGDNIGKVATVMAAGAAAAAAAVTGFGVVMGRTVTTIAKLVIKADAIGVDPTAMMALTASAGDLGIAADTVVDGLTKMVAHGKNIEEVAAALGQMTDKAEQAAYVSEMLGDKFLKLLPILAQGTDGLAAAQEEALKSGQALSAQQLAVISASNSALDDAADKWEGFWNLMAVEAAPVLELVGELAAEFLEFATGAESMNAIKGAIHGVAKAVAYLYDLFKATVGAARVLWGLLVKSTGNSFSTDYADHQIKAGGDLVLAFGETAQRLDLAINRAEQMLKKPRKFELMGPPKPPHLQPLDFDKAFKGFLPAAKDAWDQFRNMGQQALDWVGDLKIHPLTVGDYSPTAAMTKGSREAISLEQRSKFGALVAKDDKVLQEMERNRKVLEEAKKALIDLRDMQREDMMNDVAF